MQLLPSLHDLPLQHFFKKGITGLGYNFTVDKCSEFLTIFITLKCFHFEQPQCFHCIPVAFHDFVCVCEKGAADILT